MKTTLDFSLLPDDSAFEKRSMLIGLPVDLRARLQPLLQTLERADSAVMFAAHAGKQSEPWRAAAYLRAGLADYCAMEEVQSIDAPSTVALKISASLNPVLHLLELLRHLNIHVKTVTTREHKISAELEGQEFEMSTYVVTNLDAEDLAALRNGRRYSLADLQRMVEWFALKQDHWGQAT